MQEPKENMHRIQSGRHYAPSLPLSLSPLLCLSLPSLSPLLNRPDQRGFSLVVDQGPNAKGGIAMPNAKEKLYII